jgi:hypothetical protein
MQLANNDELWSVDVVPGGGIGAPVFFGQDVETIGSSGTAYTLDGCSVTSTVSFGARQCR